MTQAKSASLILLTWVFAGYGTAYSADTAEALRACAEMEDAEARLACFDKLGQQALREESTEEAPAPEKMAQPEAATQPEANVQPLPDDLSRSTNIEYVGLITSCRKGQYGDLYFVFENGQIWKKVSGRDPRIKECHFEATIKADTFGYKMRIDAIDGTFRVKRHR